MIRRFKKNISIYILLGILSLNFSPLLAPLAKAVPTVDPVAGPAMVATAAATWTQVFLTQLKEFGLDLVARLIARRMLSQYLDGIVGQINKSGRTGRQPGFVLSWRNFFTEGQYRGEDVFRAVLSNTPLCPYFKNPIRTVFNVTTNKPVTQNTRVNNLDPFTRRGRCTLPKGWTIEDYTADFARNGGWQALNQLAEPQNNFYGSLLMSMGELSAQRALDASADQGEAAAGQGFTGTRASCKGGGGSGFCQQANNTKICNNAYRACNTDRDCPNQTNADSPASYGSCLLTASVKLCSNNKQKVCLSNADCVISNAEARCTFLGETLTPSKVLGDSASKFIDSNIGWLISSDEISEALLNLFGAIIDKMVNFRGVTKPGTKPGNRADITGQDPFIDCTRTCRGKGGASFQTCIEDCGRKTDYIDLPDPTNTSPPPPNCGNGVIDSSEQCDGGNLNGKTCLSIGYTSGTLSCNSSCLYDTSACTGLTLPDSTAAITACSDGGSTPTNSNVCLTAQWFRQGQAGTADPTGLCATSNCMILNHNIWDGSSDANIYQNGLDIVRLLGALDYFNGTRVRRCVSEGDIVYGLATNITPGFSLTLNVPAGGSGTCP